MKFRVSSFEFRVLSLLCGLMLCAFSVQAELGVSLEPVEASRFVYEPFSLQLEISGGKAELPTVPSGAGYSITGVFQEPDSGNILIEIIAEEPGILTVPPFAVSTSNETIQTPLLRLPISAPRRAREMDLSIRFSATRLVVDQPVRIDVVWTSKVPFTRSYELQLDLPLLRNPAWEVYALVPDVPEKQRIGLPVNAQRVIARNAQTDDGFELSFSYQLIPRREGVYNSGAQLNCALMESKRTSSQYPSYFDNHFFNRPDTRDRYERIYLSADGPQLTARALPEKGRTVRYSGIVGDCAARASLEPTDTVVGQPMLLTVTLTNLVFGGHIRNLPEATLNGLGSEFKITSEPIHIQTSENSKSFTYIVRPLRSGLDTLPALSLDCFDPERQTYRTVRTAPLAITVEPDGKQTVYTPSRKTDPLIPLTGIRNNRKESEPMMYAFLEFLARNGWPFWFLPPLLWLLLRPWLRRRDRCRTDPAYARALHALRRFNRTVNTDEETAWKTYLADRFDLAAEAVTFEAVKPHLQHIDEELMQAVRDRFNAEETTRYAPPGTPAQRAAEARKLVKKIAKAIPVLLLLLIALLPARSDARPEPVEWAAPADALFERAMTIRAERPDEAAPLFTEAALEFEAEQRFFNAANSWFFAGENGRALANYRSAESRRPTDKTIRESIRFIRAQRTDNFQGSESNRVASHNFSKVWKIFCRWSPALRFGLLTLMVLIAWIAYLTARILGKTTPCKVWFIYGGLASVIALSLAWSFFQPSEGVVIQSTDARLGPGYAYEPAYEGILHEATEFQWLEEKNGWVLARLPDKSEAWLRETACVKIR